jgi:hypothetical protein
MKSMILQKSEKVHIIHRRMYEKDNHRHFIGVVDAYEQGVARVTGHVYTVDQTKFTFIKRQELRTRLVSVVSGDILLNVLPPSVDLDKIVYKQERKAVRVTDGSDWFLDLSEYSWM